MKKILLAAALAYSGVAQAEIFSCQSDTEISATTALMPKRLGILGSDESRLQDHNWRAARQTASKEQIIIDTQKGFKVIRDGKSPADYAEADCLRELGWACTRTGLSSVTAIFIDDVSYKEKGLITFSYAIAGADLYKVTAGNCAKI